MTIQNSQSQMYSVSLSMREAYGSATVPLDLHQWNTPPAEAEQRYYALLEQPAMAA
jgi:hypothetical protein